MAAVETSAPSSATNVSSRGNRFRIAPESFILATICLLDLGTTLFWVSYRDAAEGNPIMSYYLQHFGPYAFIGAKCVLFLMPLLIAEWARRLRPRFVHNALRVGVVGYLAVYGLGVAQVNRTEAEAKTDVAQEAYLNHVEWTPSQLRHRGNAHTNVAHKIVTPRSTPATPAVAIVQG